jgi:superfamily I DNA/RNA helicase
MSCESEDLVSNLSSLTKPGDFNPETSRSLFVVGDDAQSIYAFRGSKVEIILNFEQVYPGCKEIILNQNYRSTQAILDLAEKVLTHNPHQKKKELFTDNPENIQVSYYLARNERDEAEYIVRQLHEQYVLNNYASQDATTLIQSNFDQDRLASSFDPNLANPNSSIDASELTLEVDDFFDHPQMFQKDQPTTSFGKSSAGEDPISTMFDVYLDNSEFSGTSSFMNYHPSSWNVPEYNWANLQKLNDCAVLYRTHSQSRSLEETFLRYRLPYRLVSGVRFLDRKEIKDVIAILKFMVNGADSVSLSRFLPLVMDGVGPKTLEKILAYLDDSNYPLAPKYQEQILDLLQKMHTLWGTHDSLIDLTKELLVVSGYARYLKNEYPNKEEFNARLENIGELYSLMLPFDGDKTEPLQVRLQNFLGQIMLMSTLDQTETDDTPKINLMSLHQSKGLEFETVFLVGVEDGLLPHQNSFLEPGGMEEEVRLAYVGVTRAKKFLHLISADSRVQFGQIKANPVSRIFRPFLDSHAVRRKR